jgi:hypothetical protein
MRQIPRSFVLALIIGLITVSTAFGANVQVPDFRMISRGYMEDGSFLLATRADIDVRIEGGYKFGAEVGLSLSQPRFEQSVTLPESYDSDEVAGFINRTLRFDSASVFVRDLFGSPLDLSYFAGSTDIFASGDEFSSRFGTAPFGSSFRGYRYFTEGIIYDGIHQVRGTGLRLSSDSLADWLYLSAYAYQDLHFEEPGTFSNDVRALFNFSQIKLEAFAGATYPKGDYGRYRGGLMFYFDTGTVGQFFTQVGVPRWQPGSGEDLGAEDIYFLFEPRVRFSNASIVLSLFFHPRYYLQQQTGESGAIDTNVKFLIGDAQTSPVRGGLDTGAEYRPNADQQLRVTVSPFLSLTTAGVVWDFTIQTQVYPIKLDDLVEGFVGIQTSF